MPQSDAPYRQFKASYHVRMMGSIAVSLLTLIALVQFWPLPSEDELPDLTYSTRGQEVIKLEDVQPTKQVARKPPPPRPAVPVVVPDDVVLDDVELDLPEELEIAQETGEDTQDVEGDNAGEPVTLARAETAPKAVRIVEPEYTDEARKRKVRAEVLVEVLVNERGRVEEAKVLERYLLGKDEGEKEQVAEVGYGLEESALAAAQRWMFRPARQGDKRVRSYTTLTFSFGI